MFLAFKEALVKAITLVILDATTKYHLYIDALDIGVGACFSAVNDQGVERLTSFLSRKLQSAEIRYPIVEEELLVVVYSLRKPRKYLLDNVFTLFCDNTAVCYMVNKDEPSQQLQRWVFCTQEYQFVIKHLPSRKNAVADALSRFPVNNGDDDTNGEDDIEPMLEHILIDGSLGGYEDWL